jgi:uncharacterized protein (UPF0210 family)
MTAPVPTGFSIRTITAGLTLDSADDLLPVEEAARFLGTAQTAFENAGIPVQSTRIATQPLGDLVRDKGPDQAIQSLQKLDRFVADRDLLISVGPLLEEDVEDRDFPSWAAELVAATDETYFSIAVSDQESRVFPRSVQTAACTIRAISRIGANGEANFRFGAAARVPASTPFFPVAYHAGAPAFSIGLESAGLVSKAFANATDIGDAAESLRTLLEERLLPVQTLAMALSADTSRHYVGIDLSPAPSVETSIAEPIESLTQQPFGAPTTLAACASITQALKTTRLTSCGYSGLMLPLLEDRVLARRAAENRFDVQDLLLYSSICGTGLDVIPLPGDCDENKLAGLILDMAVLATRLGKPLAARLLPIPGKSAGDRVEFANPHLTTSVVLPAG